MNPPKDATSPHPGARHAKQRKATFGRRPFFVASLLATAGVAGIPLLRAATSDGTAAVKPHAMWDPGLIPGLDLHFDARRLNVRPLDCTDFTASSTTQPWTSVGGVKWSHADSLQLTPGGLRLTAGTDATTEMTASPLSQFCLKVRVMAGATKANISVILRGGDGKQREIRLSKSATAQSTELRGFTASQSQHIRPWSNLALGEPNTIDIRFQLRRVTVLVNDASVISVDFDGGQALQRYGVGLYDGDSESTIQNLVLADWLRQEMRTGDLVTTVPQLAQPSRCMVARQPDHSKAPVFAVDSVNRRTGIYFDGSRGLVTNTELDLKGFTIVAVVKGVGTVVGPNESASDDRTGGMQLRIDPDGSLVALAANQQEIVRSVPGVIGDSPAIVAFSLDSAGNSQLYANARPVGGKSTNVALAPGLTMAVGASHGAERYSGNIFEILRWTRPLSGAEFRTVFDSLSASWDVAVSRPLEGPIAVPMRVKRIKGSNIIPNRRDLSGPSKSAWLNLWSSWDWNWIELSVRRAVEQGANAIRLVGDVNAVYTGAIDEATYHTRLQQVVDLCASLKCNFYYCAIDLRHKLDADPVFIEHFLAGVAAVLERNKNVVAIDLCNEVASGYQLFPEDQVVSWITAWGKAIRAAAPSIPLSISDVSPGSLSAKISDVAYYARFAPVVDFFDLHAYGLGIGPDSQLLAPYELGVDRPLLIGEFGADRTAPGATPGAYYSDVRKLRDSSHLVAGALQWGAIADDFGLYSETDDRLQTDIAGEWALF